MSSRIPVAPNSGVLDDELDTQSLPPPVQSPRASSTIRSAQMPGGYLADTEDTKEMVERECEAPPVSSKTERASARNNQASSGHDPETTSVIEDPNEDEDDPIEDEDEDDSSEDKDEVMSDQYHRLKKKWEDARHSEDDVKYDPQTEVKDAWKTCFDRLVERDMTVCKAWDEDVDNILIFAGLFSAVVTAFAVDSYKWLEADPGDTTNMILQHISGQLAGTQRLEYVPTPFAITSSVRRINVCWFLSLMFALTTAVLAILCKQWVREHRQELPVLSYQEEIALRQVRFDSLRFWKVGEIVATLPLLLQIALVLFFIGIVDLLWARDRALAVIMLVWCLFTGTVVIITTVLPVAVFLYHTNGNPEGYNAERANVLPCAFKSPQSWLFLKAVLLFQRFVRNLNFNYSVVIAFSSTVESWTFSDLPIIERRLIPYQQTTSFARYLCSGLGWIANQGISTNDIVTALYQCLHRIKGADLDPTGFSAGFPPVLTWPSEWLHDEKERYRLNKHDTLLQFFSRCLLYDDQRLRGLPLMLEQLILRRIAHIEYYTKSASDSGKEKPVSQEVWNSSIFKMMSLHGEAQDWSPPLLCALIGHAIRLSFSFEAFPQDKGQRYTRNIEVMWICWLVQDGLDFWELQEYKEDAAVVRYLMEEGILGTLSQATDHNMERRAFIARCEPNEEDILYVSIRGVVCRLEFRRLQLYLEASDSWNGLVDDLKLVEEP